jgi:hypothetical protein
LHGFANDYYGKRIKNFNQSLRMRVNGIAIYHNSNGRQSRKPNGLVAHCPS